ncbi:hypothetical protein ACFX2I_010311 [Malus domestica]|nr:autophagy-related protein 18a-like [Malus domestica]
MTISNPKGLYEVSQGSGHPVLVCPGLHKGQVRVDHYGSKRTKFIVAHDSMFSCLGLTQDSRLLVTAISKGTLIRIFNALDGSLLQETLLLGISYACRIGGKESYSEYPMSAALVARKFVPKSAGLSFSGVLPKYFSSEWSAAKYHLPEGLRYTVALGHQKNTVVILVMDGSFYRCQFDPVNGGGMTQIEYHNFLKPEETSEVV